MSHYVTLVAVQLPYPLREARGPLTVECKLMQEVLSTLSEYTVQADML